MTILNAKAQGDPILAGHIATTLADTNTDKIPAQISKTHRYVLPGRNICCFMGYESKTIISVAFSHKLLRYKSDFL
jgi:hypothetical protein